MSFNLALWKKTKRHFALTMSFPCLGYLHIGGIGPLFHTTSYGFRFGKAQLANLLYGKEQPTTQPEHLVMQQTREFVHEDVNYVFVSAVKTYARPRFNQPTRSERVWAGQLAGKPIQFAINLDPRMMVSAVFAMKTALKNKTL